MAKFVESIWWCDLFQYAIVLERLNKIVVLEEIARVFKLIRTQNQTRLILQKQPRELNFNATLWLDFVLFCTAVQDQ